MFMMVLLCDPTPLLFFPGHRFTSGPRSPRSMQAKALFRAGTRVRGALALPVVATVAVEAAEAAASLSVDGGVCPRRRSRASRYLEHASRMCG